MSLLVDCVHTYLLLLGIVSPIYDHWVIIGRGGDTRPRLASVRFIVGNYLSTMQCVTIAKQQTKAISSHQLIHILYIVG